MNMTEWIQKQYVVAGIAAVCLVSMLVKCLIRHKYRAMLREVQDMGHSKHKLVKSMVMKFDACYKLKMGVPNVSLFVKKYLWHYRMMGLYMKTWENINGFCLVIVMAGSMASGTFAMMQGMPAAIVFLQLLAGVFAAGVLLLTEYIANTSNLFDMLQVDITDYLENICKPRLENELFHAEHLSEYQREYFDETSEQKVVDLDFSKKKTEPKKLTSEDLTFTKEEESVIREVIQEYLG